MAYDQLKLQNQLCFRLYTASRKVRTYLSTIPRFDGFVGGGWTEGDGVGASTLPRFKHDDTAC